MELLGYIKQIREKLEALFLQKKEFVSSEHCVITFNGNDILILNVNYAADVEIKLLEMLNFDTLENLPLLLTAAVKKHNLATAHTYWLLTPDLYQILTIESLPVAESEFAEALKWRIRSLLTFPIEEATIDYFNLPAKKSSPSQPMIAAVVSKTADLKKMITLFERAGLHLSVIDIPELALQHLTKLYEKDDRTTATVYFYDAFCILNISQQQQLYFTRRIPLSKRSDMTATEYEELSLELQRYFDYYQSQWRYPAPTRIFIASDKIDLTAAATFLSEYLSVKVDIFSLKPFITATEYLPRLEKSFLLSYGAALRDGTKQS